MKRINANARTIRELLDGAKFSIDSYQREYARPVAIQKGVEGMNRLYAATGERVKDFVEGY